MTAPLQNDLLLRALMREPTPRTPLWMMRQAGRYLPEYRATRAKAGSFLALAKTPSLATEVTLQPLDRYRLDAAILRQMLIALAMIIVMLLRPRGLWPSPEHGNKVARG